MKYKVKISSFVFGVPPTFIVDNYNVEQFKIVDFLNNPKDTCVDGKAAYVRIFIRNK